MTRLERGSYLKFKTDRDTTVEIHKYMEGDFISSTRYCEWGVKDIVSVFDFNGVSEAPDEFSNLTVQGILSWFPLNISLTGNTSTDLATLWANGFPFHEDFGLYGIVATRRSDGVKLSVLKTTSPFRPVAHDGTPRELIGLMLSSTLADYISNFTFNGVQGDRSSLHLDKGIAVGNVKALERYLNWDICWAIEYNNEGINVNSETDIYVDNINALLFYISHSFGLDEKGIKYDIVRYDNE